MASYPLSKRHLTNGHESPLGTQSRHCCASQRTAAWSPLRPELITAASFAIGGKRSFAACTRQPGQIGQSGRSDQTDRRYFAAAPQDCIGAEPDCWNRRRNEPRRKAHRTLLRAARKVIRFCRSRRKNLVSIKFVAARACRERH